MLTKKKNVIFIVLTEQKNKCVDQEEIYYQNQSLNLQPMQSPNFVLCCTNLNHMNTKKLCSLIRKSIQSFATFGYSLIQNRVKPIKIKEKLLFFQAEYISSVFRHCLLESVIVHTNSDWKNYVYTVMKQQLK